MPLSRFTDYPSRIIVTLLVWLTPGDLCAQEVEQAPDPRDMVSLAQPKTLHLEVFINGKPTGLVAKFVLGTDGTIASPRAELAELHIRVPDDGGASELVALDSIEGMTYVYDKRAQVMRMTVAHEAMAERAYGRVEEPQSHPPRAETGTGTLVNYHLRTSMMKDFRGSFAYQGASGTFEGRLFTDYGTLKSGAIVGSTVIKRLDALRLGTSWNYADPERMRNYTAGDTIASGPSWARPIRLGGFQVQHNFSLRPDLVTAALPSISGSAAVPTTVDVYVNNQLTISQQVDEGPFRITPPQLSNNGTARVQTRDATGRVVQTEQPFFISNKVLRQGLWDWSVEAGLPRQYYAAQSNTYARTGVASGTFRGGLMDWLTLEAHGETSSSRLFNASVGANFRIFDRAVATLATAGSLWGGQTGGLIYFGLDTRLWGIGVNIASQRTLGTFNDLASATAPTFNPYYFLLSYTNTGYLTSYFNALRPPRALDRASFTFPAPFDPMLTATVSFVNIEQGPNMLSSRLLNVSLARSIFNDITVFLSGSYDFRNPLQRSIFAGLSIPFGGGTTASTSVTPRGKNGAAVTVDAGHALGQEPGSYGWRVRNTGLRGLDDYREASASYRHEYGRIEAGVSQMNRQLGGYADAEGAVAGALGGGVGLSSTISDSFAIVKAGAPGVEVRSENRPVGKTNIFGTLVVPNLRAFERNHVAINPADLPIDAHVSETERVVRPARNSGVVVDFAGKPRQNGAVVILTDAKGAFIPAGSRARLEGSDEAFVVGYDGRLWLTSLHEENRITVLGMSTCSASFAYRPAPEGRRQTLGPVVCQ